MKKFIMYGAGNIGRGFIGQTFASSGYSVGFVDINQEVVNRLNNDRSYPVKVVSNDGVEVQTVNNVYGIDGKNIDLVSDEIASADAMATAIGVNVLKFIAEPIALGLKKRFEKNAKPFNIIICENLIGADEFLKKLVISCIPEYADRVNAEIGFVEASIGRMVPVVVKDEKENPLTVSVEPYNILPVDKAAFKGEIPDVKNLYPFNPFSLFIQRKLFMHNMSHATCAYLGKLRNYTYIYEAVKDYDIKYATYKALTQSAVALTKEHGVDVEPLISHADNLLYRFSNQALADTVARVGKDTIRKLGNNDRIIGSIILADKHNLPCEYICIGAAAGMHFAPDGDDSSIELSNFAKENGPEETLKKYCGYRGRMTGLICALYDMIKDGRSVTDLVDYCGKVSGKEIRV